MILCRSFWLLWSPEEKMQVLLEFEVQQYGLRGDQWGKRLVTVTVLD